MADENLMDEWDQTQFRYEDESIFARDVDGHLIRFQKSTISDYDKDVRLTIDGREVRVKKAVPQRDSQGNVIFDEQGFPIPRPTTIYDAASQEFVRQPGDVNPIPTLCHREHLPPIGVCRICVVEVYRRDKDGNRQRESKPVPACVHRVEEGMEIQTLASDNDPAAATRLRECVKTLTELLVADHLPNDSLDTIKTKDEQNRANELEHLAVQQNVFDTPYPKPAKTRGLDNTSEMIAVDHDLCILCGRCSRACNWVKGNNVIGRSGKGYLSRIAFGLDDGLGTAESGCVSCGECAITCPTDALVFKPGVVQRQVQLVASDLKTRGLDGEIVTADELATIPLFSGIPKKFMQFNGAAVVRRKLKAGDILCEEGDYGSTAFIILRGSFEILIRAKRGTVKTEKRSGLVGWLGGLRTFLESGQSEARVADAQSARLSDQDRIIRNVDDVILGEMSCLNSYPRSATIVALEEAELLEIRRNVLFMLQRNATSREILDRVYRQRALTGQLEGLPLFKELSENQRRRAMELLKDKVDLVSIDPGQLIFRQGERATDFYIVRLGFVKVTQRFGRDERVMNYIGPGNHFGEIGILSQLDPGLSEQLGEGQGGTRSATCSALDHVELIRISDRVFRELIQEFPELRPPLLQRAQELLQRDAKTQKTLNLQSSQFIEQGLFNAQSLLVIDLESCTRCDECTRACADTHQGVTRLIRDGMRFDKFLVASSCRSCLDPYCLVGCPVDAIHRNGDSLEIRIDSHCIGCGLCADNCPYGNINMHGFQEIRSDPVSGEKRAVIQQRATLCDLCASIDGRPSCVYACPHNAAFRMTGPELLAVVEKSHEAHRN